jgi:spore photoproduct lyase
MNTTEILEKIDSFIRDEAGVTTGVNKKEELRRLIYEILLVRGITLDGLKEDADLRSFLSRKLEGGRRFLALKEVLVRLRYPVAVTSENDFKLYLPRLRLPSGPVTHGLSHPFRPHRIFVQKEVKNLPFTERIVGRFPDVPVTSFGRLKDLVPDRSRLLTDMGKRDLYIVNENTDIIKPCPCTTGALGCNYHILNLGFGCPCDCSYCYLQHYSNFPGILLPANLDNFFSAADNLLGESAGRFVRIGTGEFFDSLALDDITGYSTALVEFFRDRKVRFEFKTKTANIGNLLGIADAPANIVVSWSLNPAHIVGSEELYTASLDERLAAAATLSTRGWRVGFHFDPVIYYREWEKDYFAVIDDLAASVKGKIAWISVGTLRFYRKLKPIVEQRFPSDKYFYGEFLLDPADNKMRYPRIIRTHVYRKMLEKLRSALPGVPVYLCMEEPSVWKEVFGSIPSVREVESSFLPHGPGFEQ